MQQHYSLRNYVSAAEAKGLSTNGLRESFLVTDIFVADQITCTYTFYDRYVVGGAMPVNRTLLLTPPEIFKASYFLERREMGIINVGGTGTVTADGEVFTLHNKEALYIGKGAREVAFQSNAGALFYYNSAPAHMSYPSKKITLEAAETVEVGSPEQANHRIIRKLLISGVIETCQLQMGLTELKPGSIWNTMPPHTHDRRMEVYFYFNISPGQTVSHFMGEPAETRHIWMQNNQAVISPPWSIHAGAGTGNYTFIWGMAGENLDYGDMDFVKPHQLR